MATAGRFKDFGTAVAIEDFPPLGFKLNDEEFTCKAALPGAVLLDMVRRLDSESGAAAQAVLDFISYALEDNDLERFQTLLADPDKIVQMEMLGTIVGWLVEQYTTRPTKARSRSSNGRTSGGRTSTDTSSEEE